MVQRLECLQNNLKHLKDLFVFISWIFSASREKICPSVFLGALALLVLKMLISI